uniref:RNA-dependent RNA polymerase n=1 Tax=Heterorhabditis bacteriophora TaxID=37862 RepID=A0A1I7X028_HETBA
MLHTTIPIIHGKRKAPSVDDILEVKRSCNMFSMKQEFNNLLWKKKDFLTRQRRTSLLVDPLRIEDNDIMAKWVTKLGQKQINGECKDDNKGFKKERNSETKLLCRFANFYRRVSNAPMAPEEHSAQLALIEQVIQESIIIEWPKHVQGLLREEDGAEIDFAPLIHRARNVVKCRTSHPTMRIKVCAISRDDDDVLMKQPKTVEAFFRATLVKLSYDGNEPSRGKVIYSINYAPSFVCLELFISLAAVSFQCRQQCFRQVAGRMILTQREGTPATKCADQNGATVNVEGKLIASQAAPDTHTYVLLDQMGERNAKTTGFKYENGVLCATFPEMGVTLNSMVDRRQLATRYAIQVEVALNIDNKLLVNHYDLLSDRTVSSIPHCHNQRPDGAAAVFYILASTVQYGPRCLDINRAKPYIVKLNLFRIIRCQNDDDIANLELELFGDMKCLSLTGDKAHELRDRLLEDQVLPNTLIDRREFMVDKCTSILDMTTEIQHTVWQWLFRATEMIQDVGHKLCPSPVLTEKKGAKTKKQMAASEEYQTMLSLFNKGDIIEVSMEYC